MEKQVMGGSTGAIVLEDLAGWEGEIGVRADKILKARKAEKEVDLYLKLLHAERFHPSLKVIGTLTSRMSGADGLNPQGIKKTAEVRSCFPLAWADSILEGGDFDSFEVGICDARYHDPKLREDLMNDKKIHALFAQAIYDMAYDEILETKDTENDLYLKGKGGVFSQIYGGNYYTLVKNLGIDKEIAIEAEENWAKRYPVMALERKKVFDRFQSMKQPLGIGTKVIWEDPAEYVESIFGYKRYFTLENKVCKVLYNMANSLTHDDEDFKIERSVGRKQTIKGALCSALYACAFQIQSSNMRAACNHEIQSSGATVNKELELKIWEFQPRGIYNWVVQPLNIHDEILCVKYSDINIKKEVGKFIEKNKQKIPLLDMEWKTNLKDWSEK